MRRFVNVNGVNIHYWQGGNGPDLVMLHGLGGNLAVWHFSMVGKLRKHFRVTTFDMRGHGRSDMPPTGYTTRDIAHDIVGIMDELDIVESHFLAHSFGADCVLHFGLLFPNRVKSMVIIDAMLPAMLARYQREEWEGWSYWADLLERVAGVQVPADKWQDVSYMMKLSLEVPVLFGPFRGRKRDKQPITVLLTETSLLDDYNQIHELTVENLATISLPILLVYDLNSPFSETFAVLKEALPNAKSVLLPDTALRHFSPLEQPELILEHAQAFWLEQAGGGA